LKQSELTPVSVPVQLTILLALSAKLLDPVPIDQIKEAEEALSKAAEIIPADVRARFDTAATLSDEDRKTIVDIARQALARFQPKTAKEPS
jgi:F-type H+-transporting ATPase subunit alpha